MVGKEQLIWGLAMLEIAKYLTKMLQMTNKLFILGFFYLLFVIFVFGVLFVSTWWFDNYFASILPLLLPLGEREVELRSQCKSN
jgi:hypothetical protein